MWRSCASRLFRLVERSSPFGSTPVCQRADYRSLRNCNSLVLWYANYVCILKRSTELSFIQMINCSPLGTKNILGKVLLVDILAFARTQPAPAVMLVISSAQGFVPAFSLLRAKQHLIALIPPSPGANLALRAQTDFLLSWKDVFGQSTARVSASSKASQKHSRWVRQTQDASTGGGSAGGPSIANGIATAIGQSEHNGLWGRVSKYTNNPPIQAFST